MRSKFGTALALVAVLLTGTAAAAINTKSLNSPIESTVGSATAVLLPTSSEVAIATPEVMTTPETTPMTTEPQTSSQTDDSNANPVTPIQSSGSASAAAPSPSIVYGNPNPSNGDEDEEEEDEDEEDEDEEDEDDD